MANTPTLLVYQPLIVGLGAVVLATLGNTALEWYRQHLQDRREARTIRIAFLEEIKTHRNMIAGALSSEQQEETGGSFMVPIDTFFPVFENMIGRIGVLKPAEVAAILKAYANLILNPKNLALFGHIQKNDFASFMMVDAKYLQILLNLNKAVLDACDEAIASLSCSGAE